MDIWPDDPLNMLRVVSMLVFVAAFLGIVLSLLWPGAKRRSQDAAQIPFRETDPEAGIPRGRP